MKYIWIWMLLGVDLILLVLFIVDIVKTVHFVKECVQYDGIIDFVECVVERLENSTIGFISVHMFALFIISFIMWMSFR